MEAPTPPVDAAVGDIPPIYIGDEKVSTSGRIATDIAVGSIRHEVDHLAIVGETAEQENRLRKLMAGSNANVKGNAA